MPDITIVGLGPGPEELRTVAAQKALNHASHIYVRSHGDVDLGDLLQQNNVTDLQEYHVPDATNRWSKAAEAVISGAKVEPVVLAIPGHPMFGEGLVRTVLSDAREIGLTTSVLDGLSATDMLASALDIDPIRDRVQLLAGWDMVVANRQAPLDGGLLNISPALPALVTHVYSQEILGAVTEQLLRVFPADHIIELISAAGLDAETREHIKLCELAQHPGGWLLAVYVPALDELDSTRTPATLQHIMARLRREDGCPWDRKQTNQSLAASLVDEVYEVVDAIHAEDDVNLAEELGDLLMLIMMHAQIAEERQAFRLEDVYHGIATKIVRRHPHVFGDDAVQNADEVIGVWQQIKAQEKSEAPDKPQKAADGQPHSMPAMERATRVLQKHPIESTETDAAARSNALLNAVAAVIAAGEDPNQVLKLALENHVIGTVSADTPGE